MTEFENPGFEEDEYEDTLQDLGDDAYEYGDFDITGSTESELPSVPNESADTLRNEQARKDFYDFLREKGWEKEPGNIDMNALTFCVAEQDREQREDSRLKWD